LSKKELLQNRLSHDLFLILIFYTSIHSSIRPPSFLLSFAHTINLWKKKKTEMEILNAQNVLA